MSTQRHFSDAGVDGWKYEQDDNGSGTGGFVEREDDPVRKSRKHQYFHWVCLASSAKVGECE